MRSDRSAFVPLGLVSGLAPGSLSGNGAAGVLLGMVAGLALSSRGRRVSHDRSA